ncbi:alpha/beta hydrolase [Aquimarina sp. Aq78]|uniref:alpha/beta hydrolase n=1 Tax=Aquimarina sp. Aq78 TaxID=1191889 RepID=UPI000D0F9A42|nr:alpha/beta hydrolase [Aquimarina sp. Aq78]
MKMKRNQLIILFLISISFLACTNDDDNNVAQSDFGIFKSINETTAEMNGTITSSTPAHFNNLLAKYPKLKRINMLDCPGSSDDDANLVVSKKMHDSGIEFHLSARSVIASGAVDMYVGGIKRTREQGSRIGVHSWGAAPGEPIATSYPVGHAVHLPYINYYKSVGFTQKEAEDFYYFTIKAAPAESVHWMTEEEITQYKITK